MAFLWRHIALARFAAAAIVAAAWMLPVASGPVMADPSAGGSLSSPPPPPPPDGAGSGYPVPPPVGGGGSYSAIEGGGGGGGGGGGNFGSGPGGIVPPPTFEIPGQLPTDQPQGPSVSPEEIVVVFSGNLPRSVGDSFAADHDSTVIDYFQLARLNAHVFLLAVRDTSQFGRVFNEMSQDPRPVWIQPNPAFATSPASQAASVPDQSPSKQYALDRLRLGPVLDVVTGKEIKIAIVDSGVAVSHEALAGARISVLDVVAKPGRPLAATAPEIHGTAIASIIVGRNSLRGVAPDVELLAIRAFREVDSGSGAARSSAFHLAKGISAAIDGAVRIINLSLTGPQDRLVAQSVEQALMSKIAVVAAAGNSGPGAPPAYPAAQAGVIAVTATDSVDRLYRHANRGSYVTLAAPGVDILVAKPKGYDYFSGTSMAAAYVSGLSALMIGRAGELTPSGLRKLLEATATDLGPPARDPQFGAGRVDALAAFSHLAAH